MIKRILSVVLAILLMTCCIPTMAADYNDFLKNINVIPGNFLADEQNVTRAEFAYMVASVVAGGEIEASDTRFSDVSKSDIGSGHIEFLANLGIINGYGSGEFGKDDPLTFETAYIILMRALGYSNLMNQNLSISNYTELASIVGLDTVGHINKDGYVSKSGATDIIYDVITAELKKVTYFNSKDGNVELGLDSASSTTQGILAENFGISAYKGVISDVDTLKYNIKFTVKKNLYQNNPVFLSNGVVKTYTVSSNLNIYEYNKVPVTVWVNEDDVVLHIAPDKDVDVRYLNILSVNGDDAAKGYATSQITRMTFLDDEEEYDVSDEATYKYNGKDYVGQITLAGKYARVVMQNDEVIHIETWDLEEGGIITEVTTTELRYIKGAQTSIIRNFNNYDKKMFFIAGRCASSSELKTDSLFYYYSNEDYIVIVVSEKVITDKLISKSDKNIEIGNSILNCGEPLYCLNNNGVYEKVSSSDSIVPLFGKIVKAYVAHNGKVLYIKPDDGQVITSSFYAAVTGVEEDSMSDNEGEIELLVLEQNIETKRFKLNEKTRYNDNLSMNDLANTARDLTGKGIYEFKVSEKGNVTSVSKPEAFYGYGTDTVSVKITSFSTLSGTASVKIGSNPIYFTGVPIIAIYDKDGKMSATKIEWSELSSRSVPSGVTLTFFGKGKLSTPSLVILTGALNEIGGTKVLGGVVTDKFITVNESGEQKVNIVVATSQGKKEYSVTQEVADTLKKYTFIRYVEDTKLSESDIYIRKTWDVSGYHETWQDSSTNMQMLKGTVDMADDKRICFEDGTAIFMHPSNFQIMCVDESSPNKRFDAYSVDKLVKGDTIFYHKDSEGIKFILAVK